MSNVLTLNELKRAFWKMVRMIDPLVTYEEASAITGRSISSLYCKVSRSLIKPIKTKTMLRYSDVLRIKHKEV